MTGELSETAAGAPIAYLTGEYPKVSHTFIQREIAGLRAAGLSVLPCAIRRPGPEQITGPEERAALEETFHVLSAAKNPLRLLAAHGRAFAAAPRRYLRALSLAGRTAAPGARALLWQLFYFAEAGMLARHLRRQGAAHIHNHFADSSCTVAMLTAEMTGLPFSFTMHGPTEFYAVDRWRLDEKIARARFVACISHFCRSQLMMQSDPEDWGKLVIVHCGVEPARYASAEGRAEDEAREVVFVGRLAPVKGVPVLLDAFSRIAGRFPDLRLTLVGDGEARAALEAQAGALGLRERVAFTGYLSQEDVGRRLAGADLFVLPSFAEGLPVVLMEAMASGLPVIATRIAGVSELVEDGAGGLLVPPGDAEGLAEALVRLAGDGAIRRRMGATGREKVLAEFDLGRETAWLAEVFVEACAGRPPPGLRPRS